MDGLADQGEDGQVLSSKNFGAMNDGGILIPALKHVLSTFSVLARPVAATQENSSVASAP